MIVILKQNAPADKVAAFCRELETMGFTINDSVGANTHILGLIGDTRQSAKAGCWPIRWLSAAAASSEPL